MIAYLNGTVVRVNLGQIVLDVNGVGYLIFLTSETTSKFAVGQSTTLQIAHVIKEDSQSLYGFLSVEELEAFQLLCSVNGVGPKSALAVLGQLGVGGIETAVASANDAMFRSVSGIGPKTAKLIVLSLTGKLVSGDSAISTPSSQKVVTALVGLGYAERQARAAVDSVSSENSSLPEQELLKQALATLSLSRKVSSDE